MQFLAESPAFTFVDMDHLLGQLLACGGFGLQGFDRYGQFRRADGDFPFEFSVELANPVLGLFALRDVAQNDRDATILGGHPKPAINGQLKTGH